MLGRPLLRERDQLVFGILVSFSLVWLTVFQLWPRSWQQRLVDVDATQLAPVPFRLDANTADWAELSLLPGIGERLARRIVASRGSDGPFQQADDLLRVRGIGPKTLARIRPHLLLLPTTTATPPQ